ncbi:four-carbon acid sugar kinase family protein [Streptomyces sulfonofaciens]|uniref:four-carbon acid sugar kinase family protein n=1 Tax=Streptomyces sulfonofaciens TaxID=68272 RepID=UPI001E52F6DE|nr:four-carbon acid sugar kinase family protein [Streptomyces sulfonofaciens]
MSAAQVRQALAGARRVVFLDDDPTGTQTVRDLPVLTRWSVEDIRWALRQETAGFFVLTNTRSLPPRDAAKRNREVVEACLQAAEPDGTRLVFASRGDSTLRGHFPLETDVIGQVVTARTGAVDVVVLAPAYTDAGRVTINGVHWLRTGGNLLPVADSEFARDATFGYRSSRLADWVAEKSAGRIPAGQVTEVTLDVIRDGTTEDLHERLTRAGAGRVVALDAAEDDDLRAAVLAILAAEDAGRNFVYRIGPSFVRARVGQEAHPPLEDPILKALVPRGGHGLVVVGSHVALTSRQLAKLAERRRHVSVQLDVPTLLDSDRAENHLRDAVATAAAALADDLVVLSTSRHLVTGDNETSSLDIARTVSAALTETAGRVVAARRPAFVVAKGGITSSDVATESLGIDRAWVRGSLLPGIVSLWEPVSGPAVGLPYVVFAGNVGDEDSLADVIDRLEAP